MRKELFRAKSLNKSYGQEKVLKDVSFNVFEGETIVLVGANGAGKSTLMKILGGVVKKDSGQIFFDEKLIENHSIKNAKNLGIQVVNDHSNTIDHFSVSENIFLAEKKPFFFDPKNYEPEARIIMDTVNLRCRPSDLVSTLSIPDKSKVQLAAALVAKPRLLILDEPPLFNSREDKQCLRRIMDELKSRNSSVIYITHNLDDALEYSDRILVLRDGVSASLTESRELTKETLITILSKSDISLTAEVSPPREEEAVRVEHITSGAVRDVSFSAKKGEILGIVGSVESGKSAVLDILYGLRRYTRGQIFIDGQPVKIRNPKEAVKHGFAYAIEDRVQNSGLLIDMDIKSNLSLRSLKRMSSFGWINKSMEDHFSTTYLKYIYNDSLSIDTPVRHLSNGTLHKIQLSQCFSGDPRFLLLYEPTNGMDLLSKQETMRTLTSLARSGVTIIVAASTESDDIINLCHRIIVMHGGLIKGELSREEVSKSNIISLEQQRSGEQKNDSNHNR